MDKQFAAREIRRLRKAKKWTQQDLAEASGFSVAHIGRLESATAIPSVVDFDIILKSLGSSLQVTIGNPQNPQINPQSKPRGTRVPSPALSLAVDLLRIYSECHDDERRLIIEYARSFASYETK